jgi:L-arabinose isomerase
MTTAADCEMFEDFARIKRIELDVIDSKTDTRAFEQTLRANQVYYKLEQGF